MSVNSVIILCSTGHRVTVQVTPSQTLMSVLEEVCSKRGISDPTQFDLQHHGKVLDPSNNIRFSNLPNKAQLEMVISPKGGDAGSDGIHVPIVFQLEDGTRLPPTSEVTTQSKILEALFLASINVDPSKGEPAILYMRTEIVGWENLQNSSLRSIGITTNARVLIRFFYKNTCAPGIVSSGVCSSKKAKKDDSVFTKVFNFVKDSTTSSQSSTTDSTSLMSKMGQLLPQKSEDSDENKSKKKKGPSSTEAILAKMKANHGSLSQEDQQRPEPKTKSKEAELPLPDPIIHYLDEHENVLAFDSSAAPSTIQFSNIDDAFFEHGVKDLKILQQSNMRAVKQYQDGEAPLMTSKMRKAEEEAEKRELLNKYKKSVIRVQFPHPKRYVLQIVCLSGTTIGELKDRVKEFLKDPTIAFDLIITPPKRVLKPEESFLDVGLVPASCVHISCESKIELKKEVLSNLSNYTGANAACKVNKRRKKESEPSEGAMDQSTGEGSSSSPSTSRVHTKESFGGESSEGKVPKWFKSGKQ
ncbi:tether containing UBX domain for GLUT4 [Lepeophtheirus salmonis]|uniref:tether containing UBX domain for GLUT4 n=1 Tax=Lepeophtheirus salmonis TaxID=72036 RepID=UPI001AE9F247|nr:tether containing UBX domain for GLUT4-like [Lepeophtheirus salmonis]